jgi:hypothetical protein
MNVTVRPYLIGVMGAPIGAAGLAVAVILAGLQPGYSWTADTVSRLGSPGQPHALMVRTAMIAYGLLVLATAAPLRRLVERGGVVLVTLVGAYGGAAVVAGLAPKDGPAVPPTAASQVHVAATVLGGAALIGATLLVARHGRRSIDRVTAAMAGTAGLALAVAFRALWGSPVYGLIERALLSLAALWLVTVSLRSVLSLESPGEAPNLTRSHPRSRESSRAHVTDPGLADPFV